MIARLQGILLEKLPPQVVIDCHGVGYEVSVPMSTFYQLGAVGEPLTLLTHLVVREDAHLLYGFAQPQERDVFRQLIKISGIGPRVALTILSGMTVAELLQTVSTQDVVKMTKIPGIGKKTAERLLLELKDRLKIDAVATTTVAQTQNQEDILQALLALGYSRKEAEAGLKELAADVGVSEGIKQALKVLSK